MKQSTSISIRLAAAMTAGALAACGGGGGESTSGTPPPIASAPAPAAAPSASPAPSPAPAPAPAPSAAPAPGPAPAPAPAPYVPDRLKGKTLYESTGGTTGVPCKTCHDPNPAISTAAQGSDWTLISFAVWNTRSDGNAEMKFYQNRLTGLDMQDIAAYIANPTP